MKLLQSINQTL